MCRITKYKLKNIDSQTTRKKFYKFIAELPEKIESLGYSQEDVFLCIGLRNYYKLIFQHSDWDSTSELKPLKSSLREGAYLVFRVSHEYPCLESKILLKNFMYAYKVIIGNSPNFRMVISRGKKKLYTVS